MNFWAWPLRTCHLAVESTSARRSPLLDVRRNSDSVVPFLAPHPAQTDGHPPRHGDLANFRPLRIAKVDKPTTPFRVHPYGYLRCFYE